MPSHVTDVRSNDQDQIHYCAKALRGAPQRILIFEGMHTGKQAIKTVAQLMAETKLSRKRVLEEGKDLAHRRIVAQTTRDGDIAYERDGFYYVHMRRILHLAKNPDRLKEHPTKYSPKVQVKQVQIRIPRTLIRVATITPDRIDSFSRIRRMRKVPIPPPMLERQFKRGIQRILGEQGRFTDWGGESSDLCTTRLEIEGVRHTAAIAFKGRGTAGPLTPAKMGKNADQIQRLFTEDADVFLIQYHGQIASSVAQQMFQAAQSKSYSTGKKILYGVIDGADSAKIVAAYPWAFRRRKPGKRASR